MGGGVRLWGMKGMDLKVPNKEQLTYNSYLKIHDLLSLQKLQSDPPQHDEMLFIIIHQTYELWFKQIMHEFKKAVDYLDTDQTVLMLKALNRIYKIQDVLVEQIDILETMTPNEFNYFRDKLNPASGFQSHQFRLLEYKLGLRNPAYLKYYKEDEEARKLLEDELQRPSIYDHFLKYFKRKGLDVPESLLTRDVSQAYEASKELAIEFAKVYQNPVDQNELYEVLEVLMNIDEKLLLWRYRHVQMVRRVIGITMGTGGSMGVEYLKTTLDKRAFPEIWDCRQYIINHLD
jgi:tryptophan 2,3-dioxygenase